MLIISLIQSPINLTGQNSIKGLFCAIFDRSQVLFPQITQYQKDLIEHFWNDLVDKKYCRDTNNRLLSMDEIIIAVKL